MVEKSQPTSASEWKKPESFKEKDFQILLLSLIVKWKVSKLRNIAHLIPVALNLCAVPFPIFIFPVAPIIAS